MKLIPNWNKKIHKLWTSRLSIAGTFLGIARESLPDLQASIPSKVYIALFVAIFIARFIYQPKADDDNQQ